MDVTLTPEQELLQRSARDFLETACDITVVRRSYETPELASDLWKEIAHLGWTGVAFTDEAGGQQLGYLEQALLGVEMGRRLVPVPYLASVAMTGEALAAIPEAGPSQELLKRIASGDEIAALVAPAPWLQRGGEVTFRGSPRGYQLEGTVHAVVDAQRASLLVVAAQDEDGHALFAIDPASDTVRVIAQPSLDATRPLAEVVIDGELPADARLSEGDAGPALDQAFDRARVFLAAEAVGGAERCLEMAVDYAKVREQFGHPIGSFQAVSHLLVDALLRVESARSLLYWAAWVQDSDPAHASLAASAARVLACDGFRAVAETAIQTHGGMGFTWENDLHLYYRRALWNASFPEDLVEERDRVVRMMPD